MGIEATITNNCYLFYNNQIKPFIDQGLQFYDGTPLMNYPKKIKFFFNRQLEIEGSIIQKISGLFNLSKQYFNEGQPYTGYGTAILGGFLLGTGVSELGKKGLTSPITWGKLGLGAGTFFILKQHSYEHTMPAMYLMAVSFVVFTAVSLILSQKSSPQLPPTRLERRFRGRPMGDHN